MEDPPDDLLCPVTHALFIDPVFTAAGNTYEREALETWWTENEGPPTDPLTGQRLRHPFLTRNWDMRRRVEVFRSRARGEAARVVRDAEWPRRLEGWRTLVTRLLFETHQREHVESAHDSVNFVLDILVQMDRDAEAIERDVSAGVPIPDLWWRIWHDRVRVMRSHAGNAQALLSVLDRERAASSS